MLAAECKHGATLLEPGIYLSFPVAPGRYSEFWIEVEKDRPVPPSLQSIGECPGSIVVAAAMADEQGAHAK